MLFKSFQPFNHVFQHFHTFGHLVGVGRHPIILCQLIPVPHLHHCFWCFATLRTNADQRAASKNMMQMEWLNSKTVKTMRVRIPLLSKCLKCSKQHFINPLHKVARRDADHNTAISHIITVQLSKGLRIFTVPQCWMRKPVDMLVHFNQGESPRHS